MNFGKQDLVGTVFQVHFDAGYSLIDTVGFRSPLANIRNLKNRDVTYIFSKKSLDISSQSDMI